EHLLKLAAQILPAEPAVTGQLGEPRPSLRVNLVEQPADPLSEQGRGRQYETGGHKIRVQFRNSAPGVSARGRSITGGPDHAEQGQSLEVLLPLAGFGLNDKPGVEQAHFQLAFALAAVFVQDTLRTGPIDSVYRVPIRRRCNEVGRSIRPAGHRHADGESQRVL